MSYDLLTLQELDNQTANDHLYPLFDDGWEPRLAEDEQIVWRGTAKSAEGLRYVSDKWQTVWEMGEKFELIATNKRLVYICYKYKKGGMWFGGAFAVVMQAIEAAIAAIQRRGKAAIGQVRYEWPANIVAKMGTLGPVSFSHLILTCKDTDGLVRVEFELSRSDCDKLAKILADNVAQYRKIAAPAPKLSGEGRESVTIYPLNGSLTIYSSG